MILYHGSNLEIKTIDFSVCRPYKDFGKGFYTTEIFEQAKTMSERVTRIYGGIPVVNVFEISDDFMENSGLNVKNFGSVPTEEWAVFVMNNRNKDFDDISCINCNHDCKYDIVAGPVADDAMTVLFRQYQSGLMSVDTLMKGLTFRSVTSQYSFHTENAVKLLKKAGVL